MGVGNRGRTREAERMARICRDQGFRVKETRNGYVVYGKDGTSTAGWHTSPSDHRWLKNLRADLRRLGVIL